MTLIEIGGRACCPGCEHPVSRHYVDPMGGKHCLDCNETCTLHLVSTMTPNVQAPIKTAELPPRAAAAETPRPIRPSSAKLDERAAFSRSTTETRRRAVKLLLLDGPFASRHSFGFGLLLSKCQGQIGNVTIDDVKGALAELIREARISHGVVNREGSYWALRPGVDNPAFDGDFRPSA